MISPKEVKAKAQRLEDQNYKFRTFLRNRADEHILDEQFLTLHNELFADYDCSKCANCCKTYQIPVADDEITKIAAFLRMSENDFADRYLCSADPGEEKPFLLKGKPCPLLGSDGRCQVESCKPEDCAGFPFTDQPERLSSMLSIIDHAEVCPIVYEILERLKKMYGFRNRE